MLSPIFVFANALSTGFSSKDATLLRTALDKLRTKTPMIPLKGKNIVFEQPTLNAEIEFRGWSNDGKIASRFLQGPA